jgi:mannose-1-phosphate guanylyltransferase/phosphomannomutase
MDKKPAKAVFLDRDGVINEDMRAGSDPADLKYFPGVAEAIKRLNEKQYRVIVITNQGWIAKGVTTHEAVRAVNAALQGRLREQGAVIDAVYYCPHHPEGTVKEYAIACDCRKPETGMIRRAIADFNIDPKGSFFVGDTTGDILAGKRAGLATILVKTGFGGADGRFEVTPDFVADDLMGAIKYIS